MIMWTTISHILSRVGSGQLSFSAVVRISYGQYIKPGWNWISENSMQGFVWDLAGNRGNFDTYWSDGDLWSLDNYDY